MFSLAVRSSLRSPLARCVLLRPLSGWTQSSRIWRKQVLRTGMLSRSMSSLKTEPKEESDATAVPTIEDDTINEVAQTTQVENNVTVGGLMKLAKFRLSALVVMTAGAGYVMSAGPMFSLGTFTAVSLGTMLCAASAGTFNQIIERDYDKEMYRTANRPLVTGAITVPQAKMFGYATGVSGVVMLTALTTPVTGALGLATILIYTHMYTPMKRVTKYNTELGAIVGAIPPIMGWTAALGTSGVFSSEAFLLACTLFSWQMHHFMTIAWLRRRDYARAGFVMESLGDEDGKRTARKGMFWAASMTLLPFAAFAGNITAWPCALGTGALNIGLLYYYGVFLRDRTNPSARAAMFAGFWQLGLSFALMALFMKKHEGAQGFIASLRQMLFDMGLDIPWIECMSQKHVKEQELLAKQKPVASDTSTEKKKKCPF